MKKRYKNPISCIYKIIVEKYIYIGSAKIFNKRKYEHLWKLKNNKHPNPILQNLYNKHGKDVFIFSIIEEVNIEDLLEIEQKYIDLYKNDKKYKLINILMVAGSSLGYVMSDETRLKKSLSMIGKNKGKKRSDEHCKNQSIYQKNRIITDEWREKISKTLKGRISPNKPKKFIEFQNKIYSFKEFSEMINCSLSMLYIRKKEHTERKYNCKIIDKRVSKETLSKD